MICLVNARVRWLRGGEPKRLAAVMHRRAETVGGQSANGVGLRTAASPFPPKRLTAVMHRRAETVGGQSANGVGLRTAASPFPPFAVCVRSLFEVSRGGGWEECMTLGTLHA